MPEDISGTMQASGDLAAALQDLLRQMIDKIIGGPSKGKGGEPLRNVVVMVKGQGEPINPGDFSFPWDPAGGTSSSDLQDDGKFGAAPAKAAESGQSQNGQSDTSTAAPVEDKKLEHAMASARKTSTFFDRKLHVTNDGTYREYDGSEKLSSAYEGIVTKAQAVPAPPPPPDIQKKVDEAMKLLYVFDDEGNQKGKTKVYKNYQALKQAYADAEATYANAEAAAMTNSALGQTWPVTSKSLRVQVENAYDDWRSSDADKIENALETIKSVGGSLGAHFLAQARSLYDAWNLGLAGSVAVGIPYTEILPSTWWDHNDDDKGFITIEATSSKFNSNSSSHAAQQASTWYKNHSSKTGGGGGGMIFGVTFGASASHSSSDSQSGADASGSRTYTYSSSMTNVSIKLKYGVCNIYRPWLLTELFAIDGWYLPGEKDKVVSDGTIGGMAADDDHHLLPVIPNQFLVVENVKITASGWGEAGTQMSSYMRHRDQEDQASSTSVSGGVGFLCFGAKASHSSSDASGDTHESGSDDSSWSFSGDANFGTLTLNGSQVVAYIGQIMPVSPLMDGTKFVQQDKDAQPAADSTSAAGSTPATGPTPSTPTPSPTPATPPPAPPSSGTTTAVAP